jgi:hypothetical protein
MAVPRQRMCALAQNRYDAHGLDALGKADRRTAIYMLLPDVVRDAPQTFMRSQQRTLFVDPVSRTPYLWELLHNEDPKPTPPATLLTDPRLRKFAASFGFLSVLSPNFMELNNRMRHMPTQNPAALYTCCALSHGSILSPYVQYPEFRVYSSLQYPCAMHEQASTTRTRTQPTRSRHSSCATSTSYTPHSSRPPAPVRWKHGSPTPTQTRRSSLAISGTFRTI